MENLVIEEQEKNIDIRHYWYILRRRYWIFIATFIIVVLSTVIHTFQQTPIFRAATTLVIDPDIPPIIDFKDIPPYAGSSKEYYETQFKIICSRNVLINTLDILGMLVDKNMEESNVILNAFHKNILVEPVKDTRIVKVSVDNADAALATNLVNTLARVYIKHNLDDRKDSSKDAFLWLSEQLAILKAKVEKSEMDLLQYKEEEDIVSLEKRQSLLEERISEMNENYTAALQTHLELETMLNELKQLEKNPEMSESLPRILENNFVQQIKQEYSRLELQLAQVSKKYKEKHPKIVSLQSQIDNIKERLANEVRKIAKSIEIEHRISKANISTIKRNLDELKRESMSLAQQAIQYGVLQREAESNRNMYDVLLHRLKETDISGNINSNNIRIVDEAVTPTSPIRPNKRKNIILSILLGLSLGIGLCFLVEYFDDSIKQEEDVTIFLKETLLGVIPKDKYIFSDNGKGGHKAINRAYREIKTVLNIYRQDHVLHTVLVTSTIKGEGKTTTVVYLGKIFAQSGLKVLLIDADLFNPRLGKILQVETKVGIRDYYLNTMKVDEIVKQTNVNNLYLIPAGLISPDPSEIISSDKMKELIHKVKSSFDIILIDSPPVIAALEVAALGSYVDGISLIVKANGPSTNLVKKVVDDLKSFKGKIVGVILSSVKYSTRYGNYYYYYYSQKNEKEVESNDRSPLQLLKKT
jgi:succinoglycan biosynthesis transport protein ExoP